MVDRFYGYQSETSPREIQPEYKPYRNRYPEKKVETTKKVSTTVEKTNKDDIGYQRKNKVDTTKKVENDTGIKTRKSIKPKIKLILYIAVGFSVLFTISYRNSVINESFSKKEELKSNLSAIQKTNEQLKVSIENSLNLNNVEQEAKERVGMQKLTNNQKVYVNLEKKDYVEAATEEIIIEENQNIFQKIVKGFTESI